MTDSSSGNDEPRVSLHNMSRRDRWLSAGAGALLVGPSEWAAVVEGRDGNALLGLSIVGALGILIGAVGRFPTRASWGDKSIDFLEERKATDAMVDQMTATEIGRAATELAVGHGGPRPGTTATRLLEHAAFGQQMLLACQAAASANQATFTLEPQSDGTRWDASIQRGDTRLFVEIRLVLDARSVSDLIGRIGRLPRDVRLLLVAGEVDDKSLTELMSTGEVIGVVAGGPGVDLAAEVARSIGDALG